jgi:hypothetical protein
MITPRILEEYCLDYVIIGYKFGYLGKKFTLVFFFDYLRYRLFVESDRYTMVQNYHLSLSIPIYQDSAYKYFIIKTSSYDLPQISIKGGQKKFFLLTLAQKTCYHVLDEEEVSLSHKHDKLKQL